MQEKMEINKCRKKEIADLAEFITQDYTGSRCLIYPELIAKDNNITYNLGDYEDYFDGMLEHENGKFHIFLNTHGKCDLNTPRLRFSFAHEMGHYFIDEHRNALKRGESLHHPSFYWMAQKNVVEKEADYFAANLLMPSSVFKYISNGRFSYDVVEKLTTTFNTSLSATLLRYSEIGDNPIAVVFAKNNMVKYFWHSDDFPYWNLKDYFSKKVPPLTVAGDYFNNGMECNDTETVEANDWFTSKRDIRGVKLHEKCIYQKQQGTVTSILWEV